MGKSNGNSQPWTDEELAAAVDAYLYMLQLQISEIPFSVSANAEILLSGPLYRRNEASVRYRMRNISSIFEERGLPLINAFSAAPQVGRNVKKRIHDILDSRAEVLKIILQLSTSKFHTPSLKDVIRHLGDLKEQINSISNSRIAGIGHNNPPEHIDFDAEEFSKAVDAIGEIEVALKNDNPDRVQIGALSSQIIRLGSKAFVWSGQRVTDFAKAGAGAAGTAWGLTLTGLGEQIVTSLRSVFAFVFQSLFL